MVQVLEYISKNMPRVTSFVDLMLVSDRIQNAICGLYQDLIQFFLQATIYFKKNPILNVFDIGWPGKRKRKFQQQFASLFKSIQANTEWIDVEANVGLHVLTRQLVAHGRDEILASIAPIASPPTTTSPTTTNYRMIPYVANPQFFGRIPELEHLSNTLIPSRKTKLSIVSVVGEAGLGKSHLALQYLYTHFAEYSAIFWVRAQTTAKLALSYENIAVEIGLVQASGGNNPLEVTREATKKWLRTTDHTWLLIYDNVESIDHLREYWPTGSRGSIILTTRDQNLTQPPISASLRLRCFSDEEGADYILDNFQTRGGEDAAKRFKHAKAICKACGGLPLALSQVVRYGSAFRLSIENARALSASPNSFLDAGSDLNRLAQEDYYHAVGTSSLWEHSILSLGPACAVLARFLAHLDPDAIPSDLMGIRSSPDIWRGCGRRKHH